MFKEGCECEERIVVKLQVFECFASAYFNCFTENFAILLFRWCCMRLASILKKYVLTVVKMSHMA